MAGIINYKQKYEELKARFMSAIDAAWADGFQHGMQNSQLDQAQQMLSQPQSGEQPQDSSQEDTPESSDVSGESQEMPSNAPQVDELGEHIEKLENMLGKSEISPIELQGLKKTLSDIRTLQTQINLVKSIESFKNSKLAKSISFSPRTKANLPQPAQKSLTMQEEILKGVFEKWDNESKQASNDISSILGIEGLKKE